MDSLPPTEKLPGASTESNQASSFDAFPGYALISPKEGLKIDGFEFRKQLGQGTFGEVWLVDRSTGDPKSVALKVFKLSALSEEAVRRFLDEGKSLSKFDHPGIAKIFSFGQFNGFLPYLELEFIEGGPITEFANKAKLSIMDRLKLMLQVCRALQHALQRGVLHRDLKPSNILVTTKNGTPEPKIIDFGLAKFLRDGDLASLNGSEEEQYPLTRSGVAIGTPHYMSPEQASSGKDITASSDVWSLGVILFELLTGSSPLSEKSLSGLTQEEILRLVHSAPLPRPSKRIASDDRGQTLAAQRATTLPDLVRKLEPEIDWIVLKALDRDPTRRYADAGQMGDDIESLLSGGLVKARPPSRLYVATQFFRRHRVATVTASLVAVSLIAGAGVALWRYQKEKLALQKETQALNESRQATAKAQLETENARRTADFISSILEDFKEAKQGSREAYVLQKLLSRADERRRKELKSLPAVNARVASKLYNLFRDNGDVKTAEGICADALKAFRAAGEGESLGAAECLFWLSWLGSRGDPETPKGQHPRLFALNHARAIFTAQQGADSSKAVECLIKYSQISMETEWWEEGITQLAEAKKYLDASAQLRQNLSIWWRDAAVRVAFKQNNLTEASRLVNSQITRRLYHFRPYPNIVSGLHHDFEYLGRIRFAQGKFDLAEAAYIDALVLSRSVYPPNGCQFCFQNALKSMRSQGRHQEADLADFLNTPVFKPQPFVMTKAADYELAKPVPVKLKLKNFKDYTAAREKILQRLKDAKDTPTLTASIRKELRELIASVLPPPTSWPTHEQATVYAEAARHAWIDGSTKNALNYFTQSAILNPAGIYTKFNALLFVNLEGSPQELAGFSQAVKGMESIPIDRSGACIMALTLLMANPDASEIDNARQLLIKEETFPDQGKSYSLRQFAEMVCLQRQKNYAELARKISEVERLMSSEWRSPLSGLKSLLAQASGDSAAARTALDNATNWHAKDYPTPSLTNHNYVDLLARVLVKEAKTALDTP